MMSHVKSVFIYCMIKLRPLSGVRLADRYAGVVVIWSLGHAAVASCCCDFAVQRNEQEAQPHHRCVSLYSR